MSCLVINCITNWMDDEVGLSFVSFDELFGQFQECVDGHFAGFSLAGDLEKVYVQFQYDCARLPNMVQGIRISRYSKKHRDIQAYIQVTRDQYQGAETDDAKLSLMKDLLLRVLREVAERLHGRAKSSIPQLIQMAQTL
ncbi:MAG: hypothetical protein HQ582_14720 [Planctomycetes bacterium]|nr:hypothetical protein [Planctomycetota bacterium]